MTDPPPAASPPSQDDGVDGLATQPPTPEEDAPMSSEYTPEFEGQRDIEIVGLKESSNGRSCTQHAICGAAVEVNSILRLKQTIVEIDGRPEEAVKCVLVVHGEDTCTVGFLPKVLIHTHNVVKNMNKFVQVVELYADSVSMQKRRMSHQNCGAASGIFLDDIPISE